MQQERSSQCELSFFVMQSPMTMMNCKILTHDCQQCNLLNVCRLPAHILAGYNGKVVPGTEVSVVGNKVNIGLQNLDRRMPTLLDRDRSTSSYVGSHGLLSANNISGKCRQHVQHGNAISDTVDDTQEVSHMINDLINDLGGEQTNLSPAFTQTLVVGLQIVRCESLRSGVRKNSLNKPRLTIAYPSGLRLLNANKDVSKIGRRYLRGQWQSTDQETTW